MTLAILPKAPAFCAALLLTAMPAARAAPTHFRIDPVHTRIAFRVSHLGLSQSIGVFSGANGSLDFDPADWQSARLSVDIPLARLDMGDAKWTQKVLSGDFLDAATQPVAHFASTAVESVDATHARVSGTLSLRGHDVPVVLDVTCNGSKRSVYTLFRKAVGFSATATLHRGDFGMDSYPGAVGEDVAIMVEVEAETDGEPAAPNAPDASPASAPVPQDSSR